MLMFYQMELYLHMERPLQVPALVLACRVTALRQAIFMVSFIEIGVFIGRQRPRLPRSFAQDLLWRTDLIDG